MTSAYAVRSPVFFTGAPFGFSFVRDMPREDAFRRVEFHVASGDYFGTLATLMQLMADAIASGDAAAKQRCITTLKELSEDLVYLQERYAIRKK
ncbi:MAG TPA: hypothetical protein VMH91_04240 [Candidatus Paceibacterota bacterium]|nr:hypothetical protein [Candidatus Paceibacterota bacterium]